MKKSIFLVLMLCASVSLSARIVPAGYVDLGLPSGTLWKAQNESGFYLALTAKYNFEKQLPTADQFDELRSTCSWKLLDNGYRVTGPNGNTLFFPFYGHLDCEERLQNEGNSAYFWIRDIGDHYSGFYIISQSYKARSGDANCRAHSVRLVIDGKSN